MIIEVKVIKVVAFVTSAIKIGHEIIEELVVFI